VGYLHIQNLYKEQTILLFREAYALEKLDGTSTHVSWKEGRLTFFPGCIKLATFASLFDVEALTNKFKELYGEHELVVFGEGYGGAIQARSNRYGKKLRFTAFDVKFNESWLNIPNAQQVVESLGLEFVPYEKGPATVAWFDEQRDAPSVQSRRNGIDGIQPREGIVIRPLHELRCNNDERVISKHKRDEERETKTPRGVDDPQKLAVLEAAEAIAGEWVTETRLDHVLSKLNATRLEDTKIVIAEMLDDVLREANGEIIDSKDARKAIGATTARMFKNRLVNSLKNGENTGNANS
jgi:uncharacterized protein (UPF0335 family)